MENAFFLLSLVVFFIVFFDFKKFINVFRFFGIVFSIAMIFMFNINWIFSLPVELNYFSFLFLGIALVGFYFKRKKGLLEKIKISKSFVASLIFVVLSSAFLIFVANSYFEGRWDEPRYTTPDSGGHYLYISPTVDSGIMPIFMPNAIYEAAGHNDTFLHHHDTYFPGGSAVFFMINKLFINTERLVLFQSFNILFFILVSLYLFFILRERKVFRNVYFWALALFFIFFGNLFSLVSASYTNQLFGLFFLLLSIDLFERFRETGKWGFLPISIAGPIIAYYYWFPVLVLFVVFSFFDFKKIFKTKFSIAENKQVYEIGLFFLSAFILVAGYIITVLKTNQTGMISEGSFNFSSNFFDDIKIIILFALLSLVLFVKRKIKDNENYFLANFSFAVLGYSCVLLVLFYMKIAAGYALEKSFFLTIPIIWIVGIELFEKAISKLDSDKLRNFLNKFTFLFKNVKNYSIQIISAVFVGAVFLIILGESSIIFSSELWKFKVFPTASRNLDDIFYHKNKNTNVSREQLEFVNKIKRDYSYVLNDNRILMISGIDDSLWIFAYTRVWPRSLSVMPVGAKNYGIYSPMSFYSRGIVDYRQWLFNDKDHYIVIFNQGNTKKWIKDSGFNIADYDTIFSDKFENKLLKLKSGISTRFIYSEELDLRRDYEKDHENKVWEGDKNKLVGNMPVPVNSEIISKFNNLSGLSFKLNIKKKDKKRINSDYLFKLKNGKCEENNSVAFEKIISKEDIKNVPTNNKITIFFDNPIPDSINRTFCFQLSRIGKFNDGEEELLSVETKNNVVDYADAYNYINKK